jgi:hypothetical protein
LFQLPGDVLAAKLSYNNGRKKAQGIHESVAIFDAPDAEALLEITAPFHEPGVAHVHPAMTIEEAIKVKL